jgi:hypothetical protein
MVDLGGRHKDRCWVMIWGFSLAPIIASEQNVDLRRSDRSACAVRLLALSIDARHSRANKVRILAGKLLTSSEDIGAFYDRLSCCSDFIPCGDNFTPWWPKIKCYQAMPAVVGGRL